MDNDELVRRSENKDQELYQDDVVIGDKYAFPYVMVGFVCVYMYVKPPQKKWAVRVVGVCFFLIKTTTTTTHTHTHTKQCPFFSSLHLYPHTHPSPPQKNRSMTWCLTEEEKRCKGLVNMVSKGVVLRAGQGTHRWID